MLGLSSEPVFTFSRYFACRGLPLFTWRVPCCDPAPMMESLECQAPGILSPPSRMFSARPCPPPLALLPVHKYPCATFETATGPRPSFSHRHTTDILRNHNCYLRTTCIPAPAHTHHPRDNFGLAQAKLFDAYFKFSLLCLAVAGFTAAALVSTSSGGGGGGDGGAKLSATPFLVALAVVVLNLVFFSPQTTITMMERRRVCRELGVDRTSANPQVQDPKRACVRACVCLCFSQLSSTALTG